MTKSRLFEENEVHDIKETLDILSLEQAFISCSDQERDFLCNLLDPSAGLCKPERFTTLYRIWAGLAELGRGNSEKARELFTEAKKFGFNHWRVNLYMYLSYFIDRDFEEAAKHIEPIKEKLLEMGLDPSDIKSLAKRILA
jgi:hypothetical protein